MKKLLTIALTTLSLSAQSNTIKVLEKPTVIIDHSYSDVSLTVVCVGKDKVLVTNSSSKGSYPNSAHSLILSYDDVDCIQQQ